MSISFAATPQAKEAQQARTYTDPSRGAPPSRRSGANAPYIDKDHWNKVFTEPEYFDSIAKQKGMAEGAKVSLFGDDYVYRQAMIGYMSATRNVPLDDMRKVFDVEKDGFAKKVLGKQTASARELFDWHKSKFERENEKQAAARQILNNVAQRAMTDFATGGDTAFVESVAKDIDAAGDMFSDEEKSMLWEKAEENDMKLRATQMRFAPEAKFIFDALRQTTGEGAGFGAPDMRDMATRFAKLPDKQRRAVYELAGSFAQLNQTDKGFWYQMAESLGRGASDIVERVPRNIKEQALRNDLRMLEGDQPIFAGTGVQGTAYSAFGKTPLTPEEREQAADKVRGELGVFKVERELRDLAERVIDPIKTVTVLPEIVEEGLYGAARSLPYTAVAAVPYAGAPAVAGALYSSNYDRIMLEYPDIDPDKAALIAAISAPIEAGLERMKVNTIMGRLPFFGGLVKRFQHPNQRNITRIAIGGAGVLAEQNAQEILQNATFPFVQMIGSVLDKDIPEYNLDLASMPRDLAVQFVALLPLSLMGIGALSYREISRGEAYLRNKDNLGKAGYSEEQIDRITGAATADEAQSILREESKKRDPEKVKAAAQRIVDESIALREKANPAALPRLEKQGADYVVLSPEGKELARSTDQTAAEQALVSARRETVQREMRGVTNGINLALEFINKANEARSRGEDIQKFILENRNNDLFQDYEANPTEQNLERLFETVTAFGFDAKEPEDLKNFPVLASNQGALRDGIYRSIVRIFDGADGTIVMRDFAQDNLKRAMAEGRVSIDWVRSKLNELIPQIDSDRIERKLRTETDTDVIEAFSDVAIAYFRGRITEDMIPEGFRGFFRRMAVLMADIFRRSYRLARLRAEGKLDRDFEALLAEAVGVDQQALVDRARERTEQEVGAGQNYSIGLPAGTEVRWQQMQPNDIEGQDRLDAASTWSQNTNDDADNLLYGELTKDGQVVGRIMLGVNEGGIASELDKIWIDDSMRRQGAATKLLYAAMQEAGVSMVYAPYLTKEGGRWWSSIAREIPDPESGDIVERIVFEPSNYSIGISPTMDADYLAAVERGDMETAQRMVDEAARRAGYDIGPVWHGGADGFNVFDWNRIGEQGTTEGKGFYFSNDRDLAAGYADRHGGRLLRVYLRSGKPIDGKKQTITQSKWRQILRLVHVQSEQYDEGTSPLWNYADVGYEGLEKAINEAVANITETSESDVDAISGFINGGADPQITYDAIYKLTGMTGIVESEAWGRDGHTIQIATSANHVKLADPVTYDAFGNVIPLSQRFDATTADINYSIGSRAVLSEIDRVLDMPENPPSVPTAAQEGGKVRSIAKLFHAIMDGDSIDYGSLDEDGMAERVSQAGDRILDVLLRASYEFPNFASWYESRLKMALAIFQQLDTDVAKPDNQAALLVTLAITSNGADVATQTEDGWDVYNHWKQSGRLAGASEKRDALRGAETENKLAIADKMADALGGYAKLGEFLNRKGTVAELRKAMAEQLGGTFNKEEITRLTNGELIDEVVPFSLIFGPKLGSFFNNMSGDFSTITMDRWFMRTFGRTMGAQLVAIAKDVMAKKDARLKQALKGYKGDILKRAKIEKGVKDPRQIAEALGKFFQKSENRTGLSKQENDIRLAANDLFKVADGFVLKEAPDSGTHRRWIRAVMTDGLNKFNEQTGNQLVPAEAQALLWYYEKLIHDTLGSRQKDASPDYASAANKLFIRERGTGSDRFSDSDGIKRRSDGGRSAAFGGVSSSGQSGAAGVDNYSISTSDILSRYEGMPSVVVEGGRPYSPIVRDLLKRRAAGEDIPREVIDQAINENFPAQLVEVPRSVAELPDRAVIDDAIDKGQRDKRIDVSTIEAGEKVAIRQDVPAMTRKGVGVVTVKSKAGNSYEAAVRITEPDFILNEKKSLRIAMGEAKGPHIVINGMWAADQSMPADLETWTQVGYNPDRHSFYYDRATMQQVTGGSEAYQIGNTVFVKDAQYGDGQISDISYSISTQSEIDRVQKAMGALDRSPLSRIKVYEKMQERFLRVMSDNRETLAAMEGGDLSQVRRTQILQALGELDGIISALPAEIRAKIGGYTQLAKVDPMDVFKGDQKVSEVRGMSGAIISAWMREGLNIGQAQKKTELPAGYRADRNLDPTRADRAIADVFIQRINRINEALEKFLRDEYNDAAVELFKRAKPQRSGAGEKPKGKLGATVHELFDTLKEATEWSAEKAQAWADGQWARIEAGELNPYEQSHAMLAAQVLPLFADWANADSTQRAAAVTMGKDILDRAYKGEQQRIIAQRTKRGYDRTDLSKDAGVSAEDDKARQNAVKRENSLPSKWEAAMLNLLNFDQVLRYVFGNDSKIARQISDRQRKADNAKSDDVAALSDDWATFLSKLGGGEMQGQQLLFDLSRMDEEIDGVAYSQNQLVAITMMWMQPKGRQHMEGFMDSDGQPAGKWHYNQGFVNKAEALLTEESKAIREYLLRKYDEEYDAINKVYRKVYGLNLPKNQFYSPLVVESIAAPAQAGIDPVTGGVFAAGANSPSALRSRGGAIAQPVFRDAVQTYFGHMLQMAHWKAYAEFNSEVSALLGHRDTRNVVKGKAGEQAATVMNNWLQYFQQGGNKDEANHLAINQWINRITGNFAAISLFGRVSTLALQVTQLGAASAKMPVGAYLSRFGKLMSGRLGWTTALDSDYIQRRIKDMPPAVALAMQGLRAEKPSQIRNAARWLGQHLSGFDGFFTAGTYAIVYDYQLSQARQNGMGGQEAADYAREATERIVDEIAQPTRAGARSIYELNLTNPVARAVWAFSSESRKNMGLLMFNGAKGGSRNFGKALTYVLLLNGLVGIVIRNAFRDMRDDDDDEVFDEKNWGWKRLAAQFISDPIYGIPVVGETIEGGIYTAFGVYKPSGSVFDVARGVPAATRMVTQYPAQVLEGEAEFRDIVADVNRILAAAGLFNSNIAAAASISNLAKDVFEVTDNALGDE